MPTNEVRAERAYTALHKSDYMEGRPSEETIIDVLTDLRHLSDEYGIDFNKANLMAEAHYNAEKS